MTSHVFDLAVGIEEGRLAGCRTVGVAASGDAAREAPKEIAERIEAR